MKRFAMILSAAAVIAGSTQLTHAEVPGPVITRSAPEVIEIPADQILSARELHERGLERAAPVEATRIKAGEPDTHPGRS